MEKALRNTLRNVVTQCRKLLEESIGETLQGRYGIHLSGKVEEAARLTHLTSEESDHRRDVIDHLKHIESSFYQPHETGAHGPDREQLKYEPAAVEHLIREAAFTHLNRLCAYKMMAQRGLIEDPVGGGSLKAELQTSKILKSRGFLFYLGDHPEDEALYNSAQAEVAYRHYLEWLSDSLSEELGALFSREDVASGLFPPHRTLEAVLEKLNQEDLAGIWAEDETIGWIFQYFTPKELREKARKDSAAPRNSYEMAFRNQFFTPRYVVEFLVDNTLGRTWFEMRAGDTALAERCRYLLKPGGEGAPLAERAKKDPREIKVLDPACGSGHFLLYCFDVLQTIYEEAYVDPGLGPKLRADFPDADEFRRQIPGLILANNIHGIDIDLRVTQLAALALWMRAQRAFRDIGLKEGRPRIERMNLVCAEPMPGEEDLLEEFISELSPHPLGNLIGELVRKVFARMKLAGEAGALIRIEDDIREPIEQARRQWQEVINQQAQREQDLARHGALFDYKKEDEQLKLVFDVADITDEKVWHDAESEVLSALREYARRASNGKGLLRRLFSGDAEQGFAFIDICRKKFDVVLMNPPFGDASLPSKSYIDETYGDTKGDVYKAFVECFQDRLVPGGFLGIISSRAGFFLSLSGDWRERVVLRLYRPLLLADFGMGVLDAMVETAAYVLRSLTRDEGRQLTLRLVKKLREVPTDKNGVFSTKQYEATLDLKRHQANGELQRLYYAGFLKPVEGHFARWSPLSGQIARAPAPENESYPPLVCLRLLAEEDKGSALLTSLQSNYDPRRFDVAPESLRQIPNTPFCYWVSPRTRGIFSELPPFGSAGRTVKQGLATSSDFRFARLWWEVSAETICPPSAHPPESLGGYCVLGKYRWFPLAKGGAYSPYYADLHLVVNWEHDGEELKEAGATIRNPSYYFRPGLTYPLRTSRFSPQVMPMGTVISVRGSGIYGNGLLPYLGLLASEPFDFLIKLLLGRDEHPQFDMGDISVTPVPSPNYAELSRLEELAISSFRLKQNIDSANDMSHVFRIPALVVSDHGESLAERCASWHSQIAESERGLAAHQREIDNIAFGLYQISGEDRRVIEGSSARKPPPSIEGGPTTEEEESEDEQTFGEQHHLTADLISYAIGCAFGRWDVRLATGECAAPDLPDPFAPLPVCAPGALTGEDGLPLLNAPERYPLTIGPDGILVDDPNHPEDIVARSRKVIELIWKDNSDSIEREASELLGVKELRDYFRKPAAGGFWDDHIKRYSKSRRKAPIYWLLRSSKGNYAIWLYYHRLDKDLLFKVLVNYAEPKIRLEEINLTQLREQKERAGKSGPEARKVERLLEKQESFISELNDFHDKLKRAADLHLEPDLNDGVVLNIAPLWELVPWKEAEKYWKELLQGKYEWSTISKQLHERGKIPG